MSFRTRALGAANGLLRPLSLRLLREWEYRTMLTTYRGPEWVSPPISPNDLAYLTTDNPRFAMLQRRYAGHPAAAHTQWDEAHLLKDMDLKNFRGENHYVYQMRYSPTPQTYCVTAYAVRDADRLGLFGSMQEDGLYGAYTLDFGDGYIISRDLLASINEINFICRMLGLEREDPIKVLDIGAGYGRLAQRLTEAMPAAEVTCADAVPLSTFLSEFYLRSRRSDRAQVVPLDEVEHALTGRRFDLVTNIHSFSECQISVIEWWMALLDKVDVRQMLIVPNARDEFRSTETDGSHRDFRPMLDRFGWRLEHKEPIYSETTAASKYGLYPNFCFHLFRRA